MKMRLILLVAIMSLVLVGSSFAAVQNIRVSGDINVEAVASDIEGWRTVAPGVASQSGSETFVLSQIRLRIDADLTEGVSAAIGLINERLWGASTDAASNSEILLDIAYIQMNDFMDQPLTLRIGRQNLRYGNALVIGDSGVASRDNNNLAPLALRRRNLSLRKSFDAVRAIMDYAPYTVDLVFAKINEGDTLDRRDDQNLYGVNVAYDWADYNGITEAYVWYLDQGKPSPVPAVTDINRSYVNTMGARTQFDLDDHWTLGVEGAYQFGRDVDDATNVVTSRRAFAGQFNTEYRFLDVNNSKIGANFTYLSGDSRSSSRNNAWFAMFEDQVPAEIINNLFGNSNLMYTQLSGSMMPQEDVTLGLQWTFARLANSLDADPLVGDYTVIGGDEDVLRPNYKKIGNEVNAYMLYDYTEDVQFKLIGAWFMPGNLFVSDYNSTDYQVRGGVNVNF